MWLQVGLTGKHCKMNTEENPTSGSGQGGPGIMGENIEHSKSQETLKSIPESRKFPGCARTKTFPLSFILFREISNSIIDDTFQPHGTLMKAISSPTMSLPDGSVSFLFLLKILCRKRIS